MLYIINNNKQVFRLLLSQSESFPQDRKMMTHFILRRTVDLSTIWFCQVCCLLAGRNLRTLLNHLLMDVLWLDSKQPIKIRLPYLWLVDFGTQCRTVLGRANESGQAEHAERWGWAHGRDSLSSWAAGCQGTKNVFLRLQVRKLSRTPYTCMLILLKVFMRIHLLSTK